MEQSLTQLKKLKSESILNDREKRYQLQKKLLEKNKYIITFSLTPPGFKKNSAHYKKYFLNTLKIFENKFQIIKRMKLIIDDAGYQAIFVPLKKLPISRLKKEFYLFENIYLFNIIDVDILSNNGKIGRKDFNLEDRKCIVCKKYAAKYCMIYKRHKLREVIFEYEKRIEKINKSENYLLFLKNNLKSALLQELFTSPKYGMVDLIDNGIHDDLNMKNFLITIEIIEQNIDKLFFAGISENKINPHTLNKIREKGIIMEQLMYKKTKTNVLKGGIFLFAITFFTLGYLYSHYDSYNFNNFIEMVKKIGVGLVNELKQSTLHTYSTLCFEKYGVTGIRGEVAQGLPTIQKLFKKKFYANNLNELNLKRFFYIFSRIEDTQVIKKTGINIFKKLQKDMDLTSKKHINMALIAYKKYVEKYKFSAGGTADILSLFIFLKSIFNPPHHL